MTSELSKTAQVLAKSSTQIFNRVNVEALQEQFAVPMAIDLQWRPAQEPIKKNKARVTPTEQNIDTKVKSTEQVIVTSQDNTTVVSSQPISSALVPVKGQNLQNIPYPAHDTELSLVINKDIQENGEQHLQALDDDEAKRREQQMVTT